jgi:putative nucleotidyltransferase with HDIG domain
VAAGASFIVNSVLVATAIALTSHTRIRSVWAEHFLWLWPHYLVLGALGLAMASAHAAMGTWGIAVFLVPPLMMRLSLKQYLDHTTRSVVELRVAHENLQVAHAQVTEAMQSLGKAYDGTLRSLVAALDARDRETAGHSERVAELTMAIAAEMGIERDTEQWRHISWGALLHDVGKIAIHDNILGKPGALTDREWEAMRTHPGSGHDILRSVEFLAPAGEIVLSHHERYDGGGYPGGLAGEEIPLGARIFMIADAFDAMTSDRSYRPAMRAEEALAEILRNSGTQFDPACVRAFLSVYQQRYVAAGATGRPAAQHSGNDSVLELSDSLKKAIAEAAGFEVEP